MSSSYSSRQIGAWAEKDRKKQSFGDEKTRQEVKEESQDAAATLALLRKKEKEDFALAKGFLDRYTSHLQESLKMTLVQVTKPSSPTQEETDMSPPVNDWSRLKAYLHRFVALTNTVTIVEVECERRCVPGSRPAGSQVRIKLSLYTLDIQSTNTSSTNTGSKHPHPSHLPSHVGAAAAMASLPTTQTFAWSGGVGSVGSSGGSHAHGHLQLPQDVALSISQLNLETHVYDYLVSYIMRSLLDKGREERKEERQL
jgi:hypothetical protein